MSLVPTSNLRISHLFYSIVCASFLCIRSNLPLPVLLKSLVFFFFVGLVFLFHDLFVSSFRLYDESEHFALRRLHLSLVLFVGAHVPDA